MNNVNQLFVLSEAILLVGNDSEESTLHLYGGKRACAAIQGVQALMILVETICMC
jgi:hypothetical protein